MVYAVRVEGVSETVAALAAAGAAAQQGNAALAAEFGARVASAVRGRATGRPGPRRITGQYLDTITFRIVSTGGTANAEVYSDAPQSARLELGFYGSDSLGRVYCVDDMTEVMTQSGWKTYDLLSPGDQILTLNPGSWLMEWQPTVTVNVFEGVHELLFVEARTLSSATTPDHRWLIERMTGKEQKTWLKDWRTTSSMPTSARVPLVQKMASLPTIKMVDDDIVELAAWFWTEGSYDWSMQRDSTGVRVATDRPISLAISQSERANPENVARIRRLLRRIFGEPGGFSAGAHWHEYLNKHSGSISFRVDRVSCWLLERAVLPPDKVVLPSWLLLLTQEQLDLFVDVSMAADGSTDINGVSRLTQAHEGRIRSWEMACILSGRPIVTRYSERERIGSGGEWSEWWGTTLLRSSSSYAFGSALRKDRDHASVLLKKIRGVVWCPTTANGTWLARREGTVYFTGNSQPPFPHFYPAYVEQWPHFVAAQTKLAAEVAAVGNGGGAGRGGGLLGRIGRGLGRLFGR